MKQAIFMVRFPLGSLPARGFRCPRCGEEALLLRESEALDHLATRLGLYGLQKERRRKLQRTGNSVTVSLDRELLQALGGAKPGDEVVVGQQGDRVVILPAKARA